MKLPFGKHKGQLLSEVPVKYLMWLQSDVDMDEKLAYAVDQELKKRYEEGDLDLFLED